MTIDERAVSLHITNTWMEAENQTSKAAWSNACNKLMAYRDLLWEAEGYGSEEEETLNFCIQIAIQRITL